jgi:hypothetical protein
LVVGARRRRRPDPKGVERQPWPAFERGRVGGMRGTSGMSGSGDVQAEAAEEVVRGRLGRRGQGTGGRGHPAGEQHDQARTADGRGTSATVPARSRQREHVPPGAG